MYLKINSVNCVRLGKYSWNWLYLILSLLWATFESQFFKNLTDAASVGEAPLVMWGSPTIIAELARLFYTYRVYYRVSNFITYSQVKVSFHMSLLNTAFFPLGAAYWLLAYFVQTPGALCGLWLWMTHGLFPNTRSSVLLTFIIPHPSLCKEVDLPTAFLSSLWHLCASPLSLSHLSMLLSPMVVYL